MDEPQTKKARFSQSSSYNEDNRSENRLSISDGESDSSSSEEAVGRPSFGGNNVFGSSFSQDLGSKSNMSEKSYESYIIDEGGETTNKGVYSDVASKMMAKMGHKSGTGLGRHSQGRVNIVESSLQKGRRGLGASVQGFEQKNVNWNFQKEEIAIKEHVVWMPSCMEQTLTLDEMSTWISDGKKKMVIDDEADFCSAKTVKDVCNCKSIFDNLEGEEMRKARTRSNPYETLRGVFFLNRAAVKMANMDAVLDYMFTNPKDENGHPVVPENSLLYFADICAGPGGFSEYVLWRKKWHAKGFGFTLKGSCDFKLEDFFAASSECFEPFYGVNGLEGDGNIYTPENLLEFQKFVMKSTNNRGLHFVMADGGFSVEGQENLQEILSKRLYLCQFLCALMTLHEGGHFVCKLFDIFTPFSVGLIFLMYRAFKHIAIFKPVTSRPANSERYIVCKWKRGDSDDIMKYMFNINTMFENQYSGVLNDNDILSVVPMNVLKEDSQFYDYIYDSNEILGKKQCIGLVKIQTFAKNPNLYENRQSDTRKQCLAEWSIPDEVRTAPNRNEAPYKRFLTLTETENQEYLHEVKKLDNINLESTMKSIYDYRCFLSGLEQRWMLLSLGKTYVYKWDGNLSSKWRKVDNVKMELPRNTILEVEFIQELRGEGRGQKRVTGVHVIDGMFLFGTDIRKLHFNERIEHLKTFVKAIDRPSRSDLAPIRVKDVYRCEDLSQIFERLDIKLTKGSGNRPRLCYCTQNQQDGQNMYFLPKGVCFVKTVKEPWMMAFSKSSNRKYFFDTLHRKSIFETPPEAIANFVSCQQSRLFWSWEEGVRVHPNQTFPQDERKLSRDTIVEFVQKHKR